jgi:hypothetical protein
MKPCNKPIWILQRGPRWRHCTMQIRNQVGDSQSWGVSFLPIFHESKVLDMSFRTRRAIFSGSNYIYIYPVDPAPELFAYIAGCRLWGRPMVLFAIRHRILITLRETWFSVTLGYFHNSEMATSKPQSQPNSPAAWSHRPFSAHWASFAGALGWRMLMTLSCERWLAMLYLI